MFKVGTATRIINNDLGTPIQGAGVNQVVESIRDNLEANFFYLTDGATEIMLISCDVACLSNSRVRSFRRQITRATEIPDRNIIITCTHTHAGPTIMNTNPLKEVDTRWLKRLGQWLLTGSKEAKANAVTARIGYQKGVAKIGHNRRACWSDGTHTMYRNRGNGRFTGTEGPHDSSHLVLFAEDRKGRLMGVVHNNSCHPVNFYGANFHSADFPGDARAHLRSAYGEKLAVLYLNGGIGDSSPTNLLNSEANRGGRELCCQRLGHIVAGETMRLIQEAEFVTKGPLLHKWTDLKVALRKPDPGKIKESTRLVDRVLKKGSFDIGKGISAMDIILAYGRVRLHKEFAHRKKDALPLHALRIGNLALVTNPCELYSRFMIDLRRRSPTRYTMFADITDGRNGYCPTLTAIRCGGYSGEAIHWTRLAEDAGDRIVDQLASMLAELWSTE